MIGKYRNNARRWPTLSLTRTAPRNSQAISKKKCRSRLGSGRKNQTRHQFKRWSRSRKEMPIQRKTANSPIVLSCPESKNRVSRDKKNKSRQR